MFYPEYEDYEENLSIYVRLSRYLVVSDRIEQWRSLEAMKRFRLRLIKPYKKFIR